MVGSDESENVCAPDEKVPHALDPGGGHARNLLESSSLEI